MKFDRQSSAVACSSSQFSSSVLDTQPHPRTISPNISTTYNRKCENSLREAKNRPIHQAFFARNCRYRHSLRFAIDYSIYSNRLFSIHTSVFIPSLVRSCYVPYYRQENYGHKNRMYLQIATHLLPYLTNIERATSNPLHVQPSGASLPQNLKNPSQSHRPPNRIDYIEDPKPKKIPPPGFEHQDT